MKTSTLFIILSSFAYLKAQSTGQFEQTFVFTEGDIGFQSFNSWI